MGWRCCPEAGCSDTGAGCGVVTSGWCTDGGCAGLLINTKYTRGRTWSLPTVTTLASALAHWWYAGTLVQVVHGTRPSSRTHCPAQTSPILCCMMEKSGYLDIYTLTSILFPILKHGSWIKAGYCLVESPYQYSINKEFYNVTDDFLG